MDRSGTEVLPGGVVIRWQLGEVVEVGPNTGQQVSVFAATVETHDR